MKTKAVQLWDWLQTSFWFVPTLATILAIGLSFMMTRLDSRIGDRWPQTWWIYAGQPEGARILLSTIAGSMITVAGVVFSITIVVLSLASSQFGPRLLRNFMRDPGNQIVLGTFVATFIYCLLVLRTVTGNGEEGFVPHLSITFGIVLAIISLGVLIYFIHHISASIQASTIVASVGEELDEAINLVFPEELGEEAPESRQRGKADIPGGFEAEAVSICASRIGYLQAIDNEKLMRLARQKNLLLRLVQRPGDYISWGHVLVRAWPRERVDEAAADQIRKAFIRGSERTLTQDVKFGIQQLVEIAVRAVSPGINDPFTATTCIDRLGASLSRLAERAIPSSYHYDDENHLRIIADPVTFVEVAGDAFEDIGQYGSSSMAVTLRLLESLAVIGTHIHREEDRAALLRHAEQVKEEGKEKLTMPWYRREIDARYAAVLRALTRRREAA